MSAGTANPGRIAGLDAWRAGLMLAGILLHGSAGLPYAPLFGAIGMVSQAFRMGAFYGIAGVLTAVALSRRPPTLWLRRRIIQLAIPLAFGILVISPTIWALILSIGPSGAPAPMMFQWYHLWFLAGLLLYSLIAFVAATDGRDARIVGWLDTIAKRNRVQPTTVLFAVATVTALFLGLPILTRHVISGTTVREFDVVQLIAGYLPMFAFGYLIGRSPDFARAIMARWLPAALIVVVITNVYAIWLLLIAPSLGSDASLAGEGYLRFAGSALCPPAAFVLILRSAMSIRTVPPLVSRISRASYTIYLLHYPVALAINLALLRVFAIPLFLSYAVAVIGSASLCFLFHEQIVQRSATLSLLLNGRWPGSRSITATA